MSFITTHYFKSEISTRNLLEFISLAPGDLFVMIAINSKIYGMLLTDDMVDLFLNEGSPKYYEPIQVEEWKKVVRGSNFKVFGNSLLLSF